MLIHISSFVNIQKTEDIIGKPAAPIGDLEYYQVTHKHTLIAQNILNYASNSG
jgi:hypothetical protein